MGRSRHWQGEHTPPNFDLYQHLLLGLTAPWFVARDALDIAIQRVNVLVDHPQGLKWTRQDCVKECPLHDHAGEMDWQHWTVASP